MIFTRIPAILLIAGFFALHAPANAQESSVRDPLLGFSFAVPTGWTSQKSDAGYALVREGLNGFILVLPHTSTSLADLRSEAEAGIDDGQGTQLQLAGPITPFGKNGLTAEYAGFMSGTAVDTRAFGLLSPHGGGATVLAGAADGEFSREQQRIAEEVARSITFRKPQTSVVTKEWTTTLRGKKLTYLSSYTSGTSGGYSSQRVISLCAGGRFVLSGSSVVSMEVPGAMGSSTGQEEGQGQWSVVVEGGRPLLLLRFDDGARATYVLSARGTQLYLDGERYFRTDDPVCD